MAGIRRKLARAADADIRAAIVYDRRGGAHAAERELSSVRELPRRSILLYLYAVEVPTLGGEVEGIRRFVIADGAADIAGEAVHGIEQRAALRLKQQKACRIAFISGIPVVRADHNIVFTGIGSGPVEAAASHRAPRCGLFLCLTVRVLIRQGNADEAGILGFSIPEAGIGVVAQNCDRAVRLTAQRVRVKPQRFQRFGVERLDPAIGQADQHNAVRIGRPVDGKAGRTGHIAGGFYCTGRLVYAVNMTACIDDQAVIHQNGVADRACIPSVSQRGSPVEHAVLRADRRVCVCNAIVAVRAAEVCPFGIQIMLDPGILLRSLKCDRHGRKLCIGIFSECQALLPVLRGQLHAPAPARIARSCKGADIGKALGKRECSVAVRPDAVLADGFVQINLRVSRLEPEAHGGRRGLLHGDRIVRSGFRREPVRHRDADGLLLLRSVQLHRNMFQ